MYAAYYANRDKSRRQLIIYICFAPRPNWNPNNALGYEDADYIRFYILLEYYDLSLPKMLRKSLNDNDPPT